MNNKFNITPQVLLQVKKTITETDNELVKLAGINVLEISERHIKLEMPLGDVNKNHIGTAYAISILMLMEVAGASVIRATYGLDKYIPIIKKINVLYVNPATKTLICDISITEEDSLRLIESIEARGGKGNFEIPVVVTDIDNKEIAKADFIFYLISADCI